MIINGRQIRDKLKTDLTQKVSSLNTKPILHVVYVGQNPVIDTYVGIKERFGRDIGIEVLIHQFPEDISEGVLLEEIDKIANEEGSIIIQLPLPASLNVQTILDAVPASKDPDMLSSTSVERFKEGESTILPPVVGSIREIIDFHKVELKDKRIVLVGKGKLVGLPVSWWLKKQGIEPLFLGREGDQSILKDADIIISGAGDPHFIKPDMIKKGVVLIDAGTSDSAGVTTGDIDPACAEKASLFSPVPGGVGPLTVAKLFENVLEPFVPR